MNAVTLCNFVDEAARSVQLSQSQLIVISIVEHIQQVSKEGMHIIHLWKVFQNLCELVMPAALCEFDLRNISTMSGCASRTSSQSHSLVAKPSNSRQECSCLVEGRLSSNRTFRM